MNIILIILILLIIKLIFFYNINKYLSKEHYIQNKTLNIEIVVARYNEDLNWILDYPFNQFKYTVYNKGINENFNKTNVKKIIPLPNVGVCDHTYLYHIVSNYDDNTLKPITVFFPGSVNMAHKLVKAVEILIKVLLTQEAYFITDQINDVFQALKDFTLDSHSNGYSENSQLNKGGELIKSNLRPYGRWYLYNFGNISVPYCTMFGVFSLNKKDIMKYKKFRYEKILNQLNLGPNMEVAHYMERSWGVICYPLLYTKTSLTYNEKYNKVQTSNPTLQNVRSNTIKLNLARTRPRIMNHPRPRIINRPRITNQMIKRNIRNPQFQNYLRSLFLRRNMMRKRKNIGGFNRKYRNFF